MMALKITADKIALSGLCKFIIFKPCNAGIAVINKAGIIAKYFATSFAIENVVNVIQNNARIAVDGFEGLKTVDFIQRIYEDIRKIQLYLLTIHK